MAAQHRENRVTEAELDVLKQLWRFGASTIRKITDQLYPDGGASHYATVQKLLDRLEGKACVRRSSRGRVNVFAATVDREELISRRLEETADRLCGGSFTPLVTQLVDSRRLTRADRTALRELLERLEGTGR